jgi:hypothetical protein
VFRTLVAAVVLTFIIDSSPPSAGETHRATGMYSRGAVPVFDLYFNKKGGTQIYSPDHMTIVIPKYLPKSSEMHLTVKTPFKTYDWDLGVSVGAEIAWAPDSRAFFLTRSAAGRNGIYGTSIYLLGDDQIRVIEVTPAVYKAFGQPVKCDVPEPPNVAGVKWLEGSRRLIVAAEIVNHSICDSAGTFKLYAFSVPDLVLAEEYDQLKAKRLFWSDLGWELRPADDECVHHPKSCELASNHPGGKK